MNDTVAVRHISWLTKVNEFVVAVVTNKQTVLVIYCQLQTEYVFTGDSKNNLKKKRQIYNVLREDDTETLKH